MIERVLTFSLLLAIFALPLSCTKKSEPPPGNRDGVSNGSTPDEKQEQDDDETESEPERIPQAPTTDISNNEYTVLVGLFARREAADQRAYELRANRVNNFIEHVGDKWYVCVGRYSSSGRAERTMLLLHEKGFTDATVIGPGFE